MKEELYESIVMIPGMEQEFPSPAHDSPARIFDFLSSPVSFLLEAGVKVLGGVAWPRSHLIADSPASSCLY